MHCASRAHNTPDDDDNPTPPYIAIMKLAFLPFLLGFAAGAIATLFLIVKP
jgi:hypothetical protein